MQTWSLQRKILVGSGITMLIMVVAVIVAMATLYTVVSNTTEEKGIEVVDRIQSNLELSNNLYGSLVHTGLGTLRDQALDFGQPVHGPRVQVGDKTVPNLTFGFHTVHENHEIVDRVKELAGGTATLFVKSGDEYVRISTNVTKSDGSRAVGTTLNPKGKAIKAINQGKPYYGVVYILGRPFFTGYEPMFGKDKDILGIWYTGYRLDSMKTLGDSIAKTTLLNSGFIALMDDRNNLVFQSEVTPDGYMKESRVTDWINNDAQHGSISFGGYDLSKHKFDKWGYTVVTAIKQTDVLMEIGVMGLVVLGPSLLLIFSVIVLAFLGIRRITTQLNQTIVGLSESSDHVHASANQLSASSRDMAAGASEQAAGLEETSSTLEELTAMVNSNTETTRDLDQRARSVNETTQQGSIAMKKLAGMINEIKNASNDTANIIKTIDEIAFQTNLLALNAAVEAARAGEAGRGFAVVAEEVRNLAMRSAEAARNTTELITASQEKSDSGVKAAEDVTAVLENASREINQMVELVRVVAMSTNDQSKGIEQINKTVRVLDENTQRTAASSEETSASSSELVSMVGRLNSLVNDLKKLVGGNEGTSNESISIGRVARSDSGLGDLPRLVSFQND